MRSSISLMPASLMLGLSGSAHHGFHPSICRAGVFSTCRANLCLLVAVRWRCREDPVPEPCSPQGFSGREVADFIKRW